jgi:hypothetical protein
MKKFNYGKIDYKREYYLRRYLFFATLTFVVLLLWNVRAHSTFKIPNVIIDLLIAIIGITWGTFFWGPFTYKGYLSKYHGIDTDDPLLLRKMINRYNAIITKEKKDKPLSKDEIRIMRNGISPKDI